MNNRKLKVAYVLPVYNVNRYLGECLKSLCKISTNKEIILVNDHGLEDPSQIIESYLKDENFKYISNSKNLGIGETRNIGVRAVSKDVTHIYFIDPDDYVDPISIDKIFNLELEIGKTILRKSYFTVTKKGAQLKNKNLGELHKKIGNVEHRLPLTIWGSFWSVNVVRNTPFERRVYEDVPWIIKAFTDFKNNYFVTEKPSYFYRLRVSSASNGNQDLVKINMFSRCVQDKLDFGYNETVGLLNEDYEFLYEMISLLPKNERKMVILPTILPRNFAIKNAIKKWLKSAFLVSFSQKNKMKRTFFE